VLLPDEIGLPRGWDTASCALWACARALGDTRSPAEVAAASGLAFRVSLDAEVTLAGPHAYPWREELSAAAERLGYVAEVVSSSEPPGSPLHAAAAARAVELCRRGLAAGRPTLLWGVHVPEFGLVRGIEGDLLVVSGILDGVAPPVLPAGEVGRGEMPVVFALQLTDKIALPAPDAALATLRAALLHGRGPAPTLSGFSTGLAAFRTLLGALESGRVDPAGLAYMAQRYAGARAAWVGWLPAAARVLELDLSEAERLWRRSAGMLGELAACHPFPPQGAILTSTAREEAHALAAEVLRAETAALDALESALARRAARALDRLRIVDLDESNVGRLFACARELALPLDGQIDECRAKLRPRAGKNFFGKLLFDGDELVGHLLYAPLEDAHYPVIAEGRRWLLFCPWLKRDLRARGAGARLFAALEAHARSAGVDGVLTVCTDDERFLHPAHYGRHGFEHRDRRAELTLLEKPLSDVPSHARLWQHEEAPHTGALPVVVRHAHNCPLLHAARENAVEAARAAGLSPDVADASPRQPAGVTIGGRALVHGFVPLGALTAALRDEASRW
jgi:hypothetical protein